MSMEMKRKPGRNEWTIELEPRYRGPHPSMAVSGFMWGCLIFTTVSFSVGAFVLIRDFLKFIGG